MLYLFVFLIVCNIQFCTVTNYNHLLQNQLLSETYNFQNLQKPQEVLVLLLLFGSYVYLSSHSSSGNEKQVGISNETIFHVLGSLTLKK